MLDEAKRRKNRGTDVMIGWVDAHQRPFTKELLTDIVGNQPVPEWLDVDNIIAAHPDVVMVDELGRANSSPDSSTFHWEDVERILDAGISVVGTMHAQHIASLAPQITAIIGSTPSCSIPERFLDRAEQIELVDITPEAIRRRIAHGNVFTPTELQPSSAELFNSEAFAQLRSLTVSWLADRLKGDLSPLSHHDRIVVLLDGKHDQQLLSRAVQSAQRSGAEILGLHIAHPDDDVNEQLHRLRKTMVEDAGGTYHEIIGVDIPASLLAFAEAEHASTIISEGSTSRRNGMRQLFADAVIPKTGISGQRRRWGFIIGSAILSILTVVLVANRDAMSVSTSLALYLLAVVSITAVGGRWPGLLSAIAAPLLANWYLIPPFHTFRINDPENILELVVFISATTIVSYVVAVAVRRAADAESAWKDATTLVALSQAHTSDPLTDVLALLLDTFAMDGVSILQRTGDTETVIAAAGPRSPLTRSSSDFTEDVAPDITVAFVGPTLTANDHRVLSAFVGQISRALHERSLREIATEAEALSKADDLRTAILRAVSHDLRTPLASIKASVSSLRQTDIEWPDEQRDEFLQAIESDTDKLTTIVSNLLDLSRIEAGVLQPVVRPVSIEEVLPTALRSVNDSSRVSLVAESPLPDFVADPALLDRVLANVLGNALTWSPPDKDVTLQVFTRDHKMHLHIIDHGVGIPEKERAMVLQPFHRLGDSSHTAGVGLGLAIADRLIAAMQGRLELRDTPGGGLTVAIVLPCAEGSL